MENLCTLFGALTLLEINLPNMANEFCELPHLFSDAAIYLPQAVKVNIILF